MDLEFLANVFPDSFADHFTEYSILVGADCLTNPQDPVVREFNLFESDADITDTPVTLICWVATRQALQIIPLRCLHLAFSIGAVLFSTH